jgi:hypothetical protein
VDRAAGGIKIIGLVRNEEQEISLKKGRIKEGCILVITLNNLV